MEQPFHYGPLNGRFCLYRGSTPVAELDTRDAIVLASALTQWAAKSANLNAMNEGK